MCKINLLLNTEINSLWTRVTLLLLFKAAPFYSGTEMHNDLKAESNSVKAEGINTIVPTKLSTCCDLSAVTNPWQIIHCSSSTMNCLKCLNYLYFNLCLKITVVSLYSCAQTQLTFLSLKHTHAYTKANQQHKHMHTQKQRKKARVTGSRGRMIEVCSCLSSELFQAAALSEHARDEVSQGGERAVITGRLEGHSIRQIALRRVRHTHTGPVGV